MAKRIQMPKFKSENEEAEWWASREGKAFVKQRSKESEARGIKLTGSGLVSKLPRKSSVQIALRLPEGDLEQARRIASRKGVGYQTLIKMLVHEGLAREARRG